jgi:hypothetical protein
MGKIPNKPAKGESLYYLGYFPNMQFLQRVIRGRNYSDEYFAVVDGEIVLIYNIQPDPGWLETDMVSYRNKQGMLIDKDTYYQAAATAELIRIGILEAPKES